MSKCTDRKPRSQERTHYISTSRSSKQHGDWSFTLLPVKVAEGESERRKIEVETLG